MIGLNSYNAPTVLCALGFTTAEGRWEQENATKSMKIVIT